MPLLPKADNPQGKPAAKAGSRAPSPVLICTDLDRTLLPNGDQPESPGAMDCFRELCRRPDVRLAYVSGRRLSLIKEAIAGYGLPLPDFAVGDVGTRIYRRSKDDWTPVTSWDEELARAWSGRSGAILHEYLRDLPSLRLQEAAAQGRFKLSYYAPPARLVELRGQIALRMEHLDHPAEIITSVDETTGTGLIDILPPRASKLHAVQCVARLCGAETRRMIFAGDSGNDLPVLISGLPGVLVANATDEVRAAARAAGTSANLYCARGGFLGMNGNYAAGILEGLAHFIPETADWLRDLQVTNPTP